jgi:tRNA(adenine34) deaminase
LHDIKGKKMATPFGQNRDRFFMKQALRQARKAFLSQEVPVGAIVVDAKGTILSRGYNQVEKQTTQCAHAEAIALKKAGKRLGDWRLLGCWVYVTLEPCAMCMNLIKLSRCAGVVYGANSPLFGYQLDKKGAFQLYNENVVSVEHGLCADEAAQLLKDFFRNRRKEKRLSGEEND